MAKAGHWRDPGRLKESAEAFASEGTSQKTYGNGALILRVSRITAPNIVQENGRDSIAAVFPFPDF